MMRTPFLVLARFSADEDVAGLVGQRRVQRDEVGPGQQRVEIDLFDAHFHRAFGREERIEGDDLHLEAQRAAGDDRADIARADQAQRLAGDFDAHEAVLRPLAGLGLGIGFGDLAGEREHQRDGVFGGGDRVAERGVHHHDALRRGGGDIDVVDADPGAADDLEVGGGVEDLLGHLGRAADREAIILADDRRSALRGSCR